MAEYDSKSIVQHSVMGDVTKALARWLKHIGVYAAALTALVLAMSPLREGIEALLPEKLRWLWFAVAVLPLVAALIGHGLPLWLARRRHKQLEAMAVSGDDIALGYFRITPYGNSEDEQARYARADRAHERVLSWLTRATRPILYLSGVSGAGKSSLLNAYVLPKLEAESHEHRCVVVRSFHDPVADLHRALLTPGVVWKERPPATEIETRALLVKASEYLKESRLYLVFDQFEEFLIIHERKQERVQALAALLASLIDNSLSNVHVLLVLRSDYLGSLQAFERRDVLPLLEQDTNWIEVGAFREREARKFLADSGLKIGPDLLDEVFRQIAEIEETDGLVRPITVNMIGLVLDRSAISRDRLLQRRGDTGWLLLDYLRRCIGHSIVKDQARPILRRMITPAGTRSPQGVATLARDLGLTEDTITGCLLHLATNGLVRRVDSNENVWEISHDFIARLLDRVLSTWKYGFLHTASRWLVPAALAVWTVFFVLPYMNERQISPSDFTARVTFVSHSIDPDTGEPLTMPGNPKVFAEGCELIVAASLVTVTGAEWKQFNSNEPNNALTVAQPQLLVSSNVQSIDNKTIGTLVSAESTQISTFSNFLGTVGKLKTRRAWNGAQIEAVVIAYALWYSSEGSWLHRVEKSRWDRPVSFDEFYALDDMTHKTWSDSDYAVAPLPVEARLDIFVGGQKVASTSGWVARVTEHDEDVKGLYVVKFKRMTLEQPFAELGYSQPKTRTNSRETSSPAGGQESTSK